ncbi:glutaredoxin-3 [Hyalella azteca]|uniref:Glutaredoxin-3 n=1 Tax=Hyalella azteca TaxID=294128 RepID=A0A8B7PKK4_HYAAZ|nr:glutaredoxin-3 [Hyalella azteca]
MPVVDVKSAGDFSKLQEKCGVLVCHFQAEWAPQCKQISDVISELANQPDTKDVVYCNIMAEEVPEVSQKMSITAVPTVVVTNTAQEGSPAAVVGRIDGAKPAELTTLVKKLAAKASLTSTGIGSGSVATKNGSAPEDINERLKKLVNSAPCILFMKGSPENPKCGFSRTTIELLARHNAKYSTFDILTDEEVRQGLKTFSNWPTYPQLYIAGELIGGLDILKEMDASGELANILPKKQNLDERLKSLVNQAPLMVFMKGNPENPRCGFSKTLMEILKEVDLPFSTFDILTDEEVRQGLKTYSNWPTYPQVYVKGELIGGLDIIKEMKADGSLADALKGV